MTPSTSTGSRQHVPNKEKTTRTRASGIVACVIGKLNDVEYINWLKKAHNKPWKPPQGKSSGDCRKCHWTIEWPRALQLDKGSTYQNKEKYLQNKSSRDCSKCHWIIKWHWVLQLVQGSMYQIRKNTPRTRVPGTVASVIGQLNDPEYFNWIKAAHTK